MFIQESTIFGELSSGLFRLFSGTNAAFFAHLLEYLGTELSGCLKPPQDLVVRPGYGGRWRGPAQYLPYADAMAHRC